MNQDLSFSQGIFDVVEHDGFVHDNEYFEVKECFCIKDIFSNTLCSRPSRSWMAFVTRKAFALYP